MKQEKRVEPAVSKRPYATPKLCEHGLVSHLTRAIGGSTPEADCVEDDPNGPGTFTC